MEVHAEPAFVAEEYAVVPIAFEVRRVFHVAPAAGGGFVLSPSDVAVPWVKDYDLGPDSPATWAQQFDLARWAFFAARLAGARVGGAALIVDPETSSIDMLEGRDDLAVLWDIRVAPEARGRGVGTALLGAVERRARERGCRELKVETQSINVPACRFYEAHGFVLRRANPHAYPTCPGEVQLLWYKEL